MKQLLFIAFALLTSFAFAQKKQIRAAEKAFDKGQFSKAYQLFSEIDESTVETRYASKYNTLKAAYLMGMNTRKKVDLATLRMAEAAIDKAKALETDRSDWIGLVENDIITTKLDLANDLIKDKKLSEARDLIDELYVLDIKNFDMLYNSANLSYSLEDYERALNDYKALIDAGYDGVTTTYTATNNSTGQEENFKSKTTRDVSIQAETHSKPNIIKTPSNVGDIAVKLVWLYKNSDGLAKAEEEYNRIKSKYPNDASLKLAYPSILLTLEKMEEYEKANANLGNDIKDPAIFENMALAAYKNKDYDKSIQFFQKAINLAPSYAAHVNLSNSYIEKGNLETTTAEDQIELYKNAVTQLEKAHALRPDEKGIISTLASLYTFLELPEKAAAMQAKM